MGQLEDEIGRQRRAERAGENSDLEREALISPSADLKKAIADFLAREVPPTGKYPMGGTTERSRFFGSEGVTESGWILFYRMHDGAPDAPNLLLTSAGEIRFSAGFGDPFLPLRKSDTGLSGYRSTDDPSTAHVTILMPGTEDFERFIIEALAGFVRSNGETTGLDGR
jgi:hypothetical protein